MVPLPGWTIRPATTPQMAAMMAETMIHSTYRMPTVRSCLMSPILQMPLVMLKNTRGTMSIFSMRRKMSPSGEIKSAAAGETKPMIRPMITPTRIFFQSAIFFQVFIKFPSIYTLLLSFACGQAFTVAAISAVTRRKSSMSAVLWQCSGETRMAPVRPRDSTMRLE